MEYKFYYYVKGKEYIRVFTSMSKASTFFDVLVAGGYTFKVLTLGGTRYGKNLH